MVYGLLVFAIAAFIFIAFFGIWLLQKSTKASLTDRFRDAEFIVENQRAPASWTKPKNIFVYLMQRINSDDTKTQASTGVSDKGNKSKEKKRIFQRLDELIIFFTDVSFFEDAEAQEMLLAALDKARTDWEEKSLGEIVAQESPN